MVAARLADGPPWPASASRRREGCGPHSTVNHAYESSSISVQTTSARIGTCGRLHRLRQPPTLSSAVRQSSRKPAQALAGLGERERSHPVHRLATERNALMQMPVTEQSLASIGLSAVGFPEGCRELRQSFREFQTWTGRTERSSKHFGLIQICWERRRTLGATRANPSSQPSSGTHPSSSTSTPVTAPRTETSHGLHTR